MEQTISKHYYMAMKTSQTRAHYLQGIAMKKEQVAEGEKTTVEEETKNSN